MREKKRYLYYKANCRLTLPEARALISQKILETLGTVGFSRAFVRVISWQEDEGIVACANDYAEDVIGALALVSRHEEKPLRFRLYLISGSVRPLKKKNSS